MRRPKASQRKREVNKRLSYVRGARTGVTERELAVCPGPRHSLPCEGRLCSFLAAPSNFYHETLTKSRPDKDRFSYLRVMAKALVCSLWLYIRIPCGAFKGHPCPGSILRP